MSPRTNDGEPESEHDGAPQAGTRPEATQEDAPTGEKATGETAETAVRLTEATQAAATATDRTTGVKEPAGADVRGAGSQDEATATDRTTGVEEPAGADVQVTEPQAEATQAAATDTKAPTADRTTEVEQTAGADVRGAGSQDEAAAGVEENLEGDVKVAAVRRVAAAGRRWRSVELGACAAMLAVALTAGSIALGALRDDSQPQVAAAAAVSPGLLASGDLDTSIKALQAHLRAQPKDFGSWATLGLAYVEQARTKGDPSRYPQAEQALKKSLSLRADNDEALAGQAALAAARHQFADALKYADRALKQNPYSERALCSRIDALVELGRYDDAEKAANLADERRPGVPVFTRFAYVHELRGDVTTARRVLDQALSSTTSPGDIAYVASQLGQLAWNQGRYDEALTYYARALAADDTYLPALEGRARAQAANGQQAEAIKGLENVVARYPLPGPLVELGELYEARGAKGDQEKAQDQYTLVDAWTAIARANGVNADLDTALAAADHGDRATALRAAQDDWSRRHTVHTADALAWALHVNGRDAEALAYARQATATGYRNATFLYHRGVIEKATGHPADARTHLAAALKLNPGFSPLGAGKARTALKTLEADK